jgi:hypothetical protein
MIRFTAFLLCAALGTVAATAGAETSAEPAGGAGPQLDVDTHLHMGPILLVSFSAVTVAVGAGFGWEADQLYDDWKTARAAGDPTGQMHDLSDDVHKYSVTADVLMLGGAALAIVGTVWWIVAARRGEAGHSEKATASFLPILGPGQAGAVVEF